MGKENSSEKGNKIQPLPQQSLWKEQNIAEKSLHLNSVRAKKTHEHHISISCYKPYPTIQSFFADCGLEILGVFYVAVSV
jgi:hypothetical protein